MRKDGSAPGFLKKSEPPTPTAQQGQKYVLRLRNNINAEMLVTGKVTCIDLENKVVKMDILDFGIGIRLGDFYKAEVPFSEFTEWIQG